MLDRVEEFSYMSVQFGLDKTHVLNLIRKQIQPGGKDLENGLIGLIMDTDDIYTHLGVKQIWEYISKQ